MEHLSEFMKTFEERVSDRSGGGGGFEDGCDLYCRNIFEILQNPALETAIFIEKVSTLLSLFFDRLREFRILEFKRTITSVERLFRFDTICDLLIKRFPVATVIEE